jgi:hypothetical protein
MSTQPKEPTLNTKIREQHQPWESHSVSLPASATEAVFAFWKSGPRPKEYTAKDDYGCFKTCPFLPSPGQYLQSRRKQADLLFRFKSLTEPGSSHEGPLPSTELGISRAVC